MYHPTDRIAHTTAFVTPVVEHWLEREIVLSKMLFATGQEEFLILFYNKTLIIPSLQQIKSFAGIYVALKTQHEILNEIKI